MKKSFLLILSLFILLSEAIAKPIDARLAREMADQFISKLTGSQISDTDKVTVINSIPNLYIFNYKVRKEKRWHPLGFVVLSDNDCIGQSVLAYGTQTNLDLSATSMKNLLHNYSKEIADAIILGVKDSELQNQYYNPLKQEVEPLLGEINWAQNHPYNSMLPLDGDSVRYVVGCTAVAIGQVMKYFNYPAKGNGNVAYTNNNGERIFSAMVNYDSLKIDWNRIKPRYTVTDTVKNDIQPIGKLLYYCALSVEADFSSKFTSSNIAKAHHALVYNFDYHPAARIISSEEMTGKEVQSILYRELDNKRPVIISANQHAFVCDGYKDDFFHMNWGWDDYMNGYFRLSALPVGEKNVKMPEHAIINITPNVHEKHVVLTLQKPGTLAGLMSEEEFNKITSLKIVGKINGEDLLLIKRLAGNVKNVWETGGNLQHLDLSEVLIIADKDTSYHEEDMVKSKSKFRSTITSTSQYGQNTSVIYYNFERMTDDKFKEFSSSYAGFGRKRGEKYIKKDDSYYVQYFMRKNVINSYMFSGCHSLKTIILPQKIKKIENNAFHGCSQLSEINIPKSIKEIDGLSLSDCTVLETINVSPDNKTYQSVNGVLYNKKTSTLVFYPPYKSEWRYMMPPDVRSIGKNAFYNNQFLRRVTLNKQITSIPDYAFIRCSSLPDIIIPESVTTIGDYAFAYCENLRVITLPSRLVNMGKNVFDKDNNLEGIYCKNRNAPNVQHATFNGLEENKVIKLWVPKGCASTYRNSMWGVFRGIQERE